MRGFSASFDDVGFDASGKAG